MANATGRRAKGYRGEVACKSSSADQTIPLAIVGWPAGQAKSWSRESDVRFTARQRRPLDIGAWRTQSSLPLDVRGQVTLRDAKRFRAAAPATE